MVKTLLLLLITALLYPIGLDAQRMTVEYEDSRHPKYVDITVQAGTDYLYLESFGADGGRRFDHHGGGVGAKVSGHVTIGNEPSQVPVGSIIRLIPGQAGRSNNAGGGEGGGGTAVSCKVGSSWHLLLVAGGGGGASDENAGREGNFWEDGSNGLHSDGSKLNNGGENGNSGNAGDASGGGGYKVSMPNGIPLGFLWDQGGSFGFGNGGYGNKEVMFGGKPDLSGGGGGGYSGGGGGDDSRGGGGGGSYVNNAWITDGLKEDRGITDYPQDGYINYEFTDYPRNISALQLAHSSSDKCIHTKDGWMGEGAWLELWDCLGTTAQQWVVEDYQIKPFNNTDRCVTIENASETSGSQLLLWNCHGDEHQQWVYDGVTGLFRSRKNFKKCLSLGKKTIANGTKIQLMDCAVTADQQWLFDGTRTSPTSDRIHTISPAYATDKCFHTKEGSTDNGANVELVDCLGTKAQQWYFESTYIKFNGDRDKCLTLPVGDATNGANIFLEDCNGGYRQEWVYDGFTKGIRSVRTPDKCIHIKEGSSANGANVELWNCMGTVAQEFEIEY